MKTRGRDQGQLILVAGFLVAIAIIGVAMTLSGVFFTQNVDESGLQNFESTATSQQTSAKFGADQGLRSANALSKKEGYNATALTNIFAKNLEEYKKQAQNVSQIQGVLNVTLNETTVNKSWVTGRHEPGLIPGWTLQNKREIERNRTRQVGRSPFDIAYTLDTSGSMGRDAYEVGYDAEICEYMGFWCYSWTDGEIIGGPNGSMWKVAYDNSNITEWVNEDSIRTSVTKLDRAKDANTRAVGVMNDSDRAALVEYNHNSYLVRGLTNMTTSGKDDMNDSINNLADGGRTNIPDGLARARAHLAGEGDNSENDSDYMVLLSDGLNTQGPDEDCDYPSVDGDDNDGDVCDETLEQADLAADQNITVYTIAFGSDADEELMQEIADRTGGEYSKASADNLVNILQQIIQDIKDDLPPKIETYTVEEPVLSEPIGRLYDFNINITKMNLSQNGNVSFAVMNTTQNATGFNVTKDVWNLTVNKTSNNSYKVDVTTFRNQDSTTVNENISNATSWVSFDVLGNSAEKQNETGYEEPLSINLYPQDIHDQMPASFAIKNTNKSANGTFNFEFEPVGGTLNGSSITGICGNTTGECGYSDSVSDGSYSTARLRSASVHVTYDDATGGHSNTVEVSSGD